MTVTISLDAMGGDHGVSVTVPAALAVHRAMPDVTIILVGLEDVVRKALSENSASESDRLVIQHASQVVEMDDDPRKILRSKKDSSMRVTIDLVKQGKADACVSAGNTGALMATAHIVLRTLPGISRPAICTTLPSNRGHVHMLDLGANVDSSPEQLLQFGIMASILVSETESIARPKVALLNVGEEEIKGNAVVKQANELFRNSKLNYTGYAEGDEIFMGDSDVIVCDGFVGNTTLKTSEGLVQMIALFLKTEFKRNLFRKIAAIVALPVLKAFKNRLDHRRYNGASFIGLNGVVIKSHGGTDIIGFEHAIRVAVAEARAKVPERIAKELPAMLGEEAVA
ncbi:MAG: phosphate acyltransferase PlsX [Proteobacteria bacterium]|nr:phosphate acyltransferase PlsX [Pseudomonadota bacterium]